MKLKHPIQLFALFLCCFVATFNASFASAPRDGSHDFDFTSGTWHTHIRRVLNPFDGGDQFSESDGTVTVRKVWGGRAWLEEIEADSAKGHWEGATFFSYNPETEQWNQTFISGDSGSVNPPTVGSFNNSRGVLYAMDTYKGRSVLLRGVWSEIKQDSHDYTESYSDNGGADWHPVFMAHLTRLNTGT